VVSRAGADPAWLTRAETLLGDGVAEVVQSVTSSNLFWRVDKDRSLMDKVRIRVLDALEQALEAL